MSLRGGAGVVGKVYAATFLLVRGTMSGSESNPCKCPVLERSGSTTLLSCSTARCVSHSISPIGCLLVFIPPVDKMAGLCALAFASGGMVSFDSPALLCSFTLGHSYYHLGRNVGQCNTCSPQGYAVLGQLFEALPVSASEV